MTCKSFISAAVMAAMAAFPVMSSAAAPPPKPILPCVNPAGSGGCYMTIQAAIDAVAAGKTINVYPGSYSETASNRTVLAGTALAQGPHQFGLFIGSNRGGITIQGVDAMGHAIMDSKKVAAFVTTNATNDFGPSGIFVEGDGVTISGLSIGVNNFGQNKTMEVIGDALSLQNNDLTDAQGSVYLNDWRFVVANPVVNGVAGVSHLQTYNITGNNFRDGISLDIASGAGYTGAASKRVIEHNAFANKYYWPSVSFNGSDTGVPWFVYSVGGARIHDNTFVNTYGINDVTEGHIRARGTYDNSQFDWASYFNDNHFNLASVVGTNPPAVLHEFTYPNSYGTYLHVRRISAAVEVAGHGEFVRTRH